MYMSCIHFAYVYVVYSFCICICHVYVVYEIGLALKQTYHISSEVSGQGEKNGLSAANWYGDPVSV